MEPNTADLKPHKRIVQLRIMYYIFTLKDFVDCPKVATLYGKYLSYYLL